MSSRIDFVFFRFGTCALSHQDGLAGDKQAADSGEAAHMVHHLALDSKEFEGAVELLGSATLFKEGVNQVEALVAAIFRAGVEYGRKDVLAPLLERASRSGL